VPIFVICNKSDAMLMLEKEYSYKDDSFTYIQQHLRRICLIYGASLIYTSAKRDSNCETLHHYIKHVLYSFDFSHPAQLPEKETIFVPIGWDSMAKIKMDFDSQSLCNDPDLPYDEVIRKPLTLQQSRKANFEVEITAEDDQEFLTKMAQSIEQEPASAATPSDFVAAPAPEEPKAPTSRPPDNVSTPTRLKPPAAASPPKPTLTTSGDKQPTSPRQNEHKVLADFFNSLMNKDPRRTTKRTSTGSTPTRQDAEQSMNRLKKDVGK